MDKDKLRARLAELCAEPGSEDGVPERWDRRSPRQDRGKEEGRILSMAREALAELDDPRLADGYLIDIRLSDNGAVATLVVDGGASGAWEAAAGYLREALARRLRRRRVPAIRLLHAAGRA